MRNALLCETVTGNTTADLVRARDASAADLVELRLDTAREIDVAGVLAGRHSPVVVTCRPRWEGGSFDGSEEERQIVLSRALELGAEFVDVEWRAGFDAVIARDRSRVVVSSHDFEGVPPDLKDRAHAMRATGAGTIKVAVTPSRLSETLPLIDIAGDGAACVIGMGTVGVVSRLLATRFGSCWTYAGQGVAPGQIPVERMVEEFGFRRTTRETQVYGVVGGSAPHSLSPAMHNAAFAAGGVDAVYVPLAAADFPDFETFGAAIGIQGASVTIPFKLDALRAARHADGTAAAVGAANTLRRGGEGWEATNTDVAGFLSPLETSLSGSLRTVRASVLGAGGAARAAIVGLVSGGARVSVHARRQEQAAVVASDLGATVGEWPPRAGSWDLLVNTTPLGGPARRDESPLPGGPFGGRLVYDLNYGPGESRLLRDARDAGCLTLDGLPMLVAQAERQYEWWTGKRPAPGVMRAAAERVYGGDGGACEREQGDHLNSAKETAVRMTSFDEFQQLAQRGTFVPVCREIVADLLTPVSAFLKIAEHADYAFLLESVEGGEHVGRYSFLGKDPFLILRSRGGKTIVEQAGQTTESDTPLMGTLRELMAGFHAPFVPGLPRFTGGAVGYLTYDAAAWFEPVPLQPPGAQEDEAGFMLFDTVLAFDHVRHRILIIANARITGDEDLEALYQFACAKIEFVERELERTLSKSAPTRGGDLDVTSNVTKDQFESMVRTAKEYIAAGDIYQVVLSQRFETALEADPFTVYRALRHVNPSPYMYFLRVGGRSIVGSSPEMLVRVEGRHVETHPIAGTRPRGATDEEDVRLAEELKRNEKERAEHVMLVDLGRNDVGRVSAYGSVRVPTYMALERYSHVMHLVSVVVGALDESHDRLDALVACFPAGTVSGAPKVRAMEIIAELESQRRGAYAGAVGYLDFAGNLDFCITIRTVIIEDGKAYVQAGAGIVADSNPAAEYQETKDKARAVIRALELAQSGL